MNARRQPNWKVLPHAFLITPNVPEAARLTEMEVTDLLTMAKAAAVISRLGAKYVLIKGGHLKGDPVDVLWMAGENHSLPAEHFDTTTRTAPAAFSQPRSRRD